MTRLIVFAACILTLISCSSTKENKTEQKNNSKKYETLPATLVKDPRKIGPDKSESQYTIEKNIYKINTSDNPLYGYWVGSFGKNKINIAIAHIKNDSIYGHSVCAGNFRPIVGTIKKLEENSFFINMLEPGDDKYDGIFNFIIDLSKNELKGTWKPYKNTVSSKEYTLIKRKFTYDKSVGEYPQASSRWLEVPDVENLLPEEIEIIRNEIYARHGYSFTNLKIRRIFDAKDWYIPMSVDIRDQLTDKEAHNIDLLYNYEDYYDEYYNSYGR